MGSVAHQLRLSGRSRAIQNDLNEGRGERLCHSMVKGWGRLGVLCTMRVSAVSAREAMSTLSQMWNRGSGVGVGAGLESCRQSHIKNRVRRIYCLSPLEFYNSQRRQGPISLVHLSILHV